MPTARRIPIFLLLPASALLGLGAADALHAQERGSVVGIVVDESDGSRLEGATLRVLDEGASADTDENGRFIFPDLPAGAVTVRAEAPGYSSVVERIEVSAMDVGFLQVRLPRIEAMLRELLVDVERSGPTGGETRVRGGREGAQTAADLLAESVPGVDVSWGAGSVGTGADIRIRGVSSITQSNQPAVFLDGIRIDGGSNREAPAGRGQRIQHVLETIPAHEVLSIRVVRGASASARHADSANGVILIETRRGNEPDGDGG